MTKKLKLGATPTHIHRPVTLIDYDGDDVKVTFAFKYRTRSEHAKLIDERLAAQKAALAELTAAAASATDDAVVQERSHEEQRAEQAGLLADEVLKIADGWDLDDPFTKDSLLQLEDEFDGALLAAIVAYGTALTESRVKN